MLQWIRLRNFLKGLGLRYLDYKYIIFYKIKTSLDIHFIEKSLIIESSFRIITEKDKDLLLDRFYLTVIVSEFCKVILLGYKEI